MRYSTIYLLGVAVITSACKPLTPSDLNITPEGSDAIIKAVMPASNQEPMTITSISNKQDNSPTEIELSVNEIKSSGKTNIVSVSPAPIMPQLVIAASKVFNPTEIIGFETQLLIRDLGHATIIRQEGPVEIWQYQFTHCVIDFFFYPINKSAAELIAKSWDMRSSTISSSLDKAACRTEMNIYHRGVLTNS